MSDTPITDRAQERIHNATCLPDCDSYGHNERCPYASPEIQAFEFARQLERVCNGLYGAALTHQFGCALPTSECTVCDSAQKYAKWQAMNEKTQ